MSLSGRTFLVLVAIQIVFFQSVSHARYIMMDMIVETKLHGDMLTVSVETTNKGDEPAYDIVVEAEVGHYSKVRDAKKTLQVKETLKAEFDFQLSFDKPGNYPVLVRVHYDDVNHYSFSTLGLVHINFKEAVSAKVFGKMNPVQIVKEGKVCVKLKSLDDKEKDLTIRLFIPKDISVSEPVKKIQLGPAVEKNVCFPVSNFSAFPGSKCAIYALMEYEHNEKHYSAAVASTVEVLEKKKLTKNTRLIVLGIPFGLLILYVFSIFVRKGKTRGSSGQNH